MKHVLIVEDDRFLAKAYEVAFQREGISSEMAFDGVEALQKISLTKPDLVVLDLILPLKNGFDVLKEMKANKVTEKIPVIIASNLGQPKEINLGKKLGALDYIVKSETSITDVLQMVKSALGVTK